VPESDKNFSVRYNVYYGTDEQNELSSNHFLMEKLLALCSRISILLKQVRLKLWFDGENGCDVEYME
jgi:hypothetical protein